MNDKHYEILNLSIEVHKLIITCRTGKTYRLRQLIYLTLFKYIKFLSILNYDEAYWIAFLLEWLLNHQY